MTGHSRGFSVEDLREIYEAENPLAEVFVRIFKAFASEVDLRARERRGGNWVSRTFNILQGSR
jgi:hypothetical protein